MAATEWEWKELMMMLKRIQLELAEFSKRVDYPLGNEAGIAKCLSAIVRQARMAITNGDYDTNYVGNKSRLIRAATYDWNDRITKGDLERPRIELGEEYFVNSSNDGLL